MRDGFLLDPEVAYFNHGGYGACPVEVFDEYQRLQRELERAPTEFLARRFAEAMREARAALGGVRRRGADDLVFCQNATSALNAVIRSLRIRPEEEILTTKHEYGADPADARVHPRERRPRRARRARRRTSGSGRVPIVVSHITSPTALVLPVAEICDAARRAGVLSIVDGAHVPGPHAARRRRRWGGRVCGQLPQVAVRAEGLRIPVGATGAPGLDRAARRQLGLPRGRRLRRAPRLAGHARSGGLPRGAEGDRRCTRRSTRRRARRSRTRPSGGSAPLGLRPLRGARAPLMRALTVKKPHPVALRERPVRVASCRGPGLRLGGHDAPAGLDRAVQRRGGPRAAGRARCRDTLAR